MQPDARFARADGPAAASAALVTYDVSAAEIAATRAKYAGLSCDTPQGYEDVRLAIGHVRDTRVAVEKRRVELKADALAYGRLVDSTAKRLTDLLLEVEEPLKAKKAAIDDAAARKKAEAEAEKIRAVEAEIAATRAKQEAEARAVREAEEKRLAEERAALDAARKKLAEAHAMQDARRLAEEEERRAARAAEDARIEAARKAERERLDAAAAVERARIDAEREKLAAERREEEERQRVARAALKAEEDRLLAERVKAERAEFERQAKAKAEREAIEKVERERVEREQRAAAIAAAAPDVEKLRAFAGGIRAIVAPEAATADAADVLVRAVDRLDEVADYLEDEARKLAGTGP